MPGDAQPLGSARAATTYSPWAGLLLFVFVLLALVPEIRPVELPAKQVPTGDGETQCEKHEVLYGRIRKDLERFKYGITPDIWDKQFDPGCKPSDPCPYLSLIILNGTAYLTSLTQRHPGSLGVATLLSGFLLEIYETVRKFNIPDVEFAITHFDDPPEAQPGVHSPSKAPVLLSLAKSDDMTSIIMPFSAHFRCFSDPFDKLVLDLTAVDKYGWSSKKETAVGRYSEFCAWWHQRAKFPDGNEVPCARSYLPKLSRRFEGLLDCKTAGITDRERYIPFRDQASYKYLVSTDGWTASSKLAKYLLLNSTILKQHSPKKEYYYDAIKPMEHYVPFYVNHQDDIIEQIEWLRQHDAEAQRIAAAGREFAMQHLTRPARLCYWRKLLTEIAKLQRYQPSCKSRRMCVPLLSELSYLGHFIDGVSYPCNVHQQLDEIHGEKLDHGHKVGNHWGDVVYTHGLTV